MLTTAKRQMINLHSPHTHPITLDANNKKIRRRNRIRELLHSQTSLLFIYKKKTNNNNNSNNHGGLMNNILQVSSDDDDNHGRDDDAFSA